jgi:hypothetical protein
MDFGDKLTAAEPIGRVLERSAGLYDAWGRQIREDPLPARFISALTISLAG